MPAQIGADHNGGLKILITYIVSIIPSTVLSDTVCFVICRRHRSPAGIVARKPVVTRLQADFLISIIASTRTGSTTFLTIKDRIIRNPTDVFKLRSFGAIVRYGEEAIGQVEPGVIRVPGPVVLPHHQNSPVVRAIGRGRSYLIAGQPRLIIRCCNQERRCAKFGLFVTTAVIPEVSLGKTGILIRGVGLLHPDEGPVNVSVQRIAPVLPDHEPETPVRQGHHRRVLLVSAFGAYRKHRPDVGGQGLKGQAKQEKPPKDRPS